MIDLFGNTEEDLLNDYFLYWRKKGYPHYDCSEYDKQKELLSLKLFDENTIFKNKTIKQTMHSLGFLWTYFPNWIDVQYGNQKTIKELWDDDNELKKLIYKTYQWEKKFGNGYITVNRLRQNSKVYLSKQSVSNFRPTAAKFIYNKYGNKGIVWDMSSGWGGRLFGFLSSDCKKYIGTEPSKNTYEGLTKLKKDFPLKEIELFNYGSEFYYPKENSLDLCFTSPPYFDTEKYSDDENQSYLKYPSKDLWLNDFYRCTLQNCFNGLKSNSYLIINIANTPKHKWLESETLKICIDLGFKYIETLNLELSSISGNGVKHEPIFIFKKYDTIPR